MRPSTTVSLSGNTPDRWTNMSTMTKMTTDVRFETFLANIRLTPEQRSDGQTKHSGIRTCLNERYYNLSSASANSLLVGSWGKSTEVRPPRDIDLLFVLPASVKARLDARPWGTNAQSELLQEVKRMLEKSYPRTTMRGDGQVVVVSFSSFAVEVVPAFKEIGVLYETGKYLVCDTNGGGSWKVTHPTAEAEHVKSSEDKTRNTRDLIRMAKTWQSYCSVPLKSFQLELLAVKFLTSWEHAGKSTVYYDWMMRDFFAFLIAHANSLLNYVKVPGTDEMLWLGTEWKSRAQSAFARASKACEYETSGKAFDAGWEWQKIFGDDMPLS